MKKKIILLPIETTSRELASKILLAIKLVSHNFDIFIGDKKSIFEFSKYTRGAIYIDKGYHKGISDKIYKNLNTKNIKIISLDEENAVDFKNFQQLNLRYPDTILSHFSKIFLWGETQFNYLYNNRKNFDEKKIKVSGHPRFDLLSNKLNQLYIEDAKLLKNKFQKFILINTNFGLGNNIYDKEIVKKKYSSRFPQLDNLIEYQLLQVNNFIELAKKISNYFPKYKVILRPHPEENLSTYEKKLKKNSNIIIINKGSVIPYIMASDLLIHHDCTTSIEAAMLEKNSIAYTKDLNLTLTTDIPLRISYQYDTFSKICDHINQIQTLALKIDRNILKKYFNFHKSSVDIIIKNIVEIKCIKPVVKNYFIYKILVIFKNIYRQFFKNKNHLYEKKIEGLNFTNLKNLTKNLSRILNLREVNIIKIHDKLFKISYEK